MVEDEESIRKGLCDVLVFHGMQPEGVERGDDGLRRALSNEVKGVSKVRQKSFSDGVALLEVESKDAPDRLAESLYQQDFGDFKLDIQDVTATTLTVQLRKR